MGENDTQRCVALFRERMGRCGGRLYEDRNHWRWEGKNIKGYPVNADAGTHEGFASVNFQFMCEEEGYRGVGIPCYSVTEFKKQLEDRVAEFGLKSKDYEQMKLW